MFEGSGRRVFIHASPLFRYQKPGLRSFLAFALRIDCTIGIAEPKVDRDSEYKSTLVTAGLLTSTMSDNPSYSPFRRFTNFIRHLVNLRSNRAIAELEELLSSLELELQLQNEKLKKQQAYVDNIDLVLSQEKGSRITQSYIRQHQVLVAVNDTNPGYIAVRLYATDLPKPEIGHVYISIKESEYILDDIHIDATHRNKKWGVFLLGETLMILDAHGPVAIRGSFVIQDQHEFLKHYFEKFRFVCEIASGGAIMTVRR